jgi:hypothetical protein
MSLPFIESAGPYFVLVGVLVAGIILLAGYVLDWIRAEEVGPGPLNGRSQTPS